VVQETNPDGSIVRHAYHCLVTTDTNETQRIHPIAAIHAAPFKLVPCHSRRKSCIPSPKWGSVAD
jgi:hypothetical protein